MFIVKLIVTALCFFITKMQCTNYCNVCINHTLCKFNKTKPGPSCEGYDTNLNLTNDDIDGIVQKINERRHFVASGLTRNYRLPQAANMRKIVWSNELSLSAQRWADQCDISEHLDKEDECRNLENEKVGQCVASISGVTRGLNVRSFIDYWFMKSLTYIGSISFYNHSTDYSTRQFTQLIWANTHSVGCGRVKFYINNGRRPIDRLVCNFAPTGNINEETVYAIGFPATQCPKDTVPDSTYTSLCTTLINTIDKPRNTFNEENLSTVNNKHLETILKLKELIKNETGGNRKQKIRHIWKNESSDYFLDYEVRSHQPPIKHPVHFNTKIYHHLKPMSTTMYQHPSPLRSFKVNKCTRRGCKTPIYQAVTGCTRKIKPQTEYFSRSTPSEKTFTSISIFPTRPLQCTRGMKSTPTLCTCDLPTKCQCTLTEIYPTPECQAKPCNNILREEKNLLFRKFKKPPNSHLDIRGSSNKNIGNNFNPMHIDIPRRNYRNLRKNSFSPQRNYPKRLYKNERKRRQYDIKPFWQENTIGKKKALRGIRYTTLARKKNKRPAATSSHHSIHITEKITLKVTPEIKRHMQHPKNKVKEKYLSFDELMTLRKNNKLFANARRDEANNKVVEEVGDAENPVAEAENPVAEEEATTAKAANKEETKYPKIKHCTRKITCTWTMPTHPGDANKQNFLNSITKTRFGYVEGCSRTSTCTRDFMERNRFSNSGGAGGNGDEDGAGAGKDEDYCEKRALKIQRRNSENKHDYKFDNYEDGESRTTTSMKEHNDDYKCICTDGMP